MVSEGTIEKELCDILLDDGGITGFTKRTVNPRGSRVSCKTFKEAGVATDDHGVVVRIGRGYDSPEFFFTIQEQ